MFLCFQIVRYQGMVKGYSGVFRLGEATSTWDADSPVSCCTSYCKSILLVVGLAFRFLKF